MSASDELQPAILRKDFPILERKVNGKPLVYFDNAATTQKPRIVIDAISHYYSHYNANVHRGIHTLSMEASEAYEAAHARTADFIGASSMEEIVFTNNTTESINLVAQSFATPRVQKGEEILSTIMEHHSNLVPWQQVAKEKGARLVLAGIHPDGSLDMEDFQAKLTEKTKFVVVSHCSNVLGTINPVKKMISAAHAVGAKVLVDGAQAAPHLPLDMQELNADFYAFSAHKMLGPTGVGVLYGKKELLESMPPFLTGGEMIHEVWEDRATWNVLPWKFEAGTPNIAGGIGFGVALEYLQQVGMNAIHRHDQRLVQHALERLQELKKVTLYGPPASQRNAVVSFNLEGVHPHDVSAVLDKNGVAVRAGDHCGQPLMRKMGMQGSVRMSYYLYNTEQEIDVAVDALKTTQKVFA